MAPTTHYRTLWISDLHLGTPQAKADFLLDFLHRHDADRYYLVGDVFDGWALKRSWYWPASHNEVVQELLRKAQSGDVTYIPGNHDEAARDFPSLQFGGITLRRHTVHTTADGRRFLVVHGDEFEGVVRHSKWVEVLGEWTYAAVLTVDDWLTRLRRLFNLPYWSLANYLKESQQIKQFITEFEEAAAREARNDDFDGIICGHIHRPRMRTIAGTQYVNVGDWVQSCTALAEHESGDLELLRWIPEGHGLEEEIPADTPLSQENHTLSAETLDSELQANREA